MGIEPTPQPWEGRILPLYYARIFTRQSSGKATGATIVLIPHVKGGLAAAFVLFVCGARCGGGNRVRNRIVNFIRIPSDLRLFEHCV